MGEGSAGAIGDGDGAPFGSSPAGPSGVGSVVASPSAFGGATRAGSSPSGAPASLACARAGDANDAQAARVMTEAARCSRRIEKSGERGRV